MGNDLDVLCKYLSEKMLGFTFQVVTIDSMYGYKVGIGYIAFFVKNKPQLVQDLPDLDRLTELGRIFS